MKEGKAALRPHGSRVLTQFGRDRMPVEMITNEYQLSHCSVAVMVDMRGLVLLGRVLAFWCMRVRLRDVVPERCGILVATGNAVSDSLEQQMACSIGPMSKALEA